MTSIAQKTERIMKSKTAKVLIFFDFETNSLHNPCPTELSMVSVLADDLFANKHGDLPRIQHKLTLCFDPARMIESEAKRITGLSNKMLENCPKVDKQSIQMISAYINVLRSKLNTSLECACLIAHNGHKFDFPIFERIVQASSLERQFQVCGALKLMYHGSAICHIGFENLRLFKARIPST